MSGQLVAIVFDGNTTCLEGPAHFLAPTSCSPAMALCDVLADAGLDAVYGALDSFGE
jgi:hypothetical protein